MCAMSGVVSMDLVETILMGNNGTFVVPKPAFGINYRLKCPIGINDTLPTHEKCLLQTRLNTSQSDRNVMIEITKANKQLEGNYELLDENGTNALNLTLVVSSSELVEDGVSNCNYARNMIYLLECRIAEGSTDIIWMENNKTMGISPLDMFIYREVKYDKNTSNYINSYRSSELTIHLNKSIGSLPANAYEYYETMVREKIHGHINTITDRRLVVSLDDKNIGNYTLLYKLQSTYDGANYTCSSPYVLETVSYVVDDSYTYDDLILTCDSASGHGWYKRPVGKNNWQLLTQRNTYRIKTVDSCDNGIYRCGYDKCKLKYVTVNMTRKNYYRAKNNDAMHVFTVFPSMADGLTIFITCIVLSIILIIITAVYMAHLKRKRNKKEVILHIKPIC
jgi:hypothetical protein